jgi:hypothetical protein
VRRRKTGHGGFRPLYVPEAVRILTLAGSRWRMQAESARIARDIVSLIGRNRGGSAGCVGFFDELIHGLCIALDWPGRAAAAHRFGVRPLGLPLVVGARGPLPAVGWCRPAL